MAQCTLVDAPDFKPKKAEGCSSWCKGMFKSSHCVLCDCAACGFCKPQQPPSLSLSSSGVLPSHEFTPIPVPWSAPEAEKPHVPGRCIENPTKMQQCSKWCNNAHARDHCSKCECQDCQMCYDPQGYKSSKDAEKQSASDKEAKEMASSPQPPPPPPPPQQQQHPPPPPSPSERPQHASRPPPSLKSPKKKPLPPPTLNPKQTVEIMLPPRGHAVGVANTATPAGVGAGTGKLTLTGNPLSTVLFLAPFAALFCVVFSALVWFGLKRNTQRKNIYQLNQAIDDDDGYMDNSSTTAVRVVRSARKVDTDQ